MMNSKKSELLNLLNIGPRSARWLESIGVKNIKSFMKNTPENMYSRLNKKHNTQFHRAFLYVMRAAQYYELNKDKRAQASRWWEFKEVKRR